MICRKKGSLSKDRVIGTITEHLLKAMFITVLNEIHLMSISVTFQCAMALINSICCKIWKAMNVIWYRLFCWERRYFAWLLAYIMMSLILQIQLKDDNVRVILRIHYGKATLIARFMGPAWGPSGASWTHVGPMLAPWTLLSGYFMIRK